MYINGSKLINNNFRQVLTIGYILAILFLAMHSTTIHVKTDVKTRDEVKKVAEDHGLSLTGLINIVLKQIARTKHLAISLDDEELSEYLVRLLKQAEEDLKKGNTSPKFKTADEFIDYLHKQVA